MGKFISMVFTVALGLVATGHLKSATIEMAKLAARAQHHQISYAKLSRLLTHCEYGTATCSENRKKMNDAEGSAAGLDSKTRIF
jgi:hypothetical protein